MAALEAYAIVLGKAELRLVEPHGAGPDPSDVTPNASATACPSDISIGDTGDISIGGLHLQAT